MTGDHTQGPLAAREVMDPTRFWRRLRAVLERLPAEETTPPRHARVGAVLVLIEDAATGPQVVLTRRRRDLRSHPGQLSFPGGRLDAGESLQEAALREAHEEVGVRADSVEVVGVGPVFYIPPSRFWVAPVVARWRAPHPLTENPWEVDEILRVPLATLLDADRWRHAPLSLGGSSWAWQLDQDLLWGATAVVLASLLDTVVPDWRGGRDPADLGEQRAVRPWEQAPAWGRRPRLTGGLPEVDQHGLPHVTAAQMRAVRAWLAQHGVGLRERAEQAGRAVTTVVRQLHSDTLDHLEVTVLAGPSSNGAGGLAAARLLAAAGAEVDVIAVGAPRDPTQLELLRAIGVAITEVGPDGIAAARAPGRVVVDAMLGIGTDPPLADLPELVSRWLRRHDVPVVALELPSGLVADVGLRGPCVTVDVTVTLGLPVVGLLEPVTHAYLGDLYLADLGVPPVAWRRVGVEPSPTLFARGPLVRLTADRSAGDAGTPDQGAVRGG